MSTASRNAPTSRRSSSRVSLSFYANGLRKNKRNVERSKFNYDFSWQAKNEPQSNDRWESSQNSGSMQASGRDTKDVKERQPYIERYNVSTERPSPQSSSRVTVTAPQPYKHTRTHKPNGSYFPPILLTLSK